MTILETAQTSIFGMKIDRLTMDQAVGRIQAWITNDQQTCRYVVTPNLDHVLQLQQNANLRDAYRSASLVVADGWPLVTASRLFNDPLPERVAGSDLVPKLLTSMNEHPCGGTVFLLGAAPGVADAASQAIQQRWPKLRVVGTYSPPLGFEHHEAENQQILERIKACSPDVLIVGFGAPKQELWLKRFHEDLTCKVAIAAGATIDFLAGRQTRAPVWVRNLNLEWSHRLLTNPRRLAARYARNAWMLPGLIYREWQNQIHTGT